MRLDESRQQALAEQAHQQGGVPLWQRLPRAARFPATVGGEQAHVRMPLDQIPCRGDRDDEAGAGVVPEAFADEFAHGFGGGAAQLGEQLPPPAKARTQQPRESEHDVAVRNIREHLLA
jgi:hypothetical protein